MKTAGTHAFLKAYTGARADVVSLVPENTTSCLDIGCSIGTLGEALKIRSPNMTVTGIEIDEDMAKEAIRRLDRVLCLDLNKVDLQNHLAIEQFDCVILADVLEHLVDPWSLLRKISSTLKPGSVVVASLPNVCHWSTVASLLFSRTWPLRDRGIHDRTHLRFFCKNDIESLFIKSGFNIDQWTRNFRLMESYEHPLNRFTRFARIPGLSEYFVFQYLVKATPIAEEIEDHSSVQGVG